MSLRKIARAISPFIFRYYNAVWRWGEKLKAFRDTFASNCRISMHLVDDTMFLVGDGLLCWIFLWPGMYPSIHGL